MAEKYLLEMDRIRKEFPGVVALDDVSLQIRRGEVHALMGANGAGKSTLMKILAGIYSPDSGSVIIEGEKVEIKNPAHAKRHGISIVFQELNVLPDLSVLENIFIGREEAKLGFYGWRRMRKQAQDILDDLGINMSINAKVGTLPLAQQQMVEIVKAVSTDAKLIILDEPTSSLSVKEVETLYSIMDKLHKRGVAIVYISHRMDEIFKVAERITLLRDGRNIFTDEIANVSRERLIDGIVGEKMGKAFPVRTPNIGEELLKVEGLTSKGHFNDISFSLKKGEILGFAGLVGAGRTQVAKAIFGEFPYQAGRITVSGKPYKPKGSGKAIRYKIAYATEDRKAEGLMLGRSIRENTSIASIKKVMKHNFLSKKKEKSIVADVTKSLAVKTPSIEQIANNLSGGNQQKVCLAKWMLTEPDIMILDEPTRGIDIGAKTEFYNIIADMAAKGVGVILISSEESELIGLCDRIIVLREGELVGETDTKGNVEKKLMEYMLGSDNKSA